MSVLLSTTQQCFIDFNISLITDHVVELVNDSYINSLKVQSEEFGGRNEI